MTQCWTIYSQASGEVLVAAMFTAGPSDLPQDSGQYDDFDWAGDVVAVPIASPPNDARHSFTGSAWIDDPAKSRDRKAEAAKAYRETRRNAPLAVYGVFPDRAVTVKMDVESRITIMGAFNFANFMAAQGLPSSFSFTDAAGQPVTLDGAQTVALGLNVAVFSGVCDSKLDAVMQALDAAIAAGATAEEIEGIDITAGYPPSGAPEA